MKLWFDEDVTPSLIEIAFKLGHPATCNRDRGLLGASDQTVAEAVIAEDFILVTDNRQDFRKLYEPAEHVHPGLIFIPGSVRREQQRHKLAQVLAWIEERAAAAGVPPDDFMVNQLVEMDPDSGDIHAEPLPVGH